MMVGMSRARLVMTGRLSDFHLADVLQAVGLSRQYTAIELRSTDGFDGTIWVKNGRVLAAERDGVQGRSAFYGMFGASAGVFVVSRVPEPPPHLAPIGTVADLLLDQAG